MEIIDDGPPPTAGQPVPPGGWMVRESWVSLGRDYRSYTYLLHQFFSIRFRMTVSARVNGGGMEVGSVKIPDASKWGLMSKNSNGKAVLETANVEKVRKKM